MRISELTNSERDLARLSAFVQENEHLLPDPLSLHVDTGAYCLKLLSLGRVFVAEEDDEICGVMMGYINDFAGYVAHMQVLIVNDRFQGRGLGEKLVRHFLAEVEKAGMKEVELTCDASNERAASLYRKIGFRPSSVVHPNKAKRYFVYEIHD